MRGIINQCAADNIIPVVEHIKLRPDKIEDSRQYGPEAPFGVDHEPGYEGQEICRQNHYGSPEGMHKNGKEGGHGNDHKIE